MNNITVGTTAVQIPVGRGGTIIIQNVSEGSVYIGPNDGVTTANGLRLIPGAAYEFPNTVDQADPWKAVWAIADEADCDVRYGNV